MGVKKFCPFSNYAEKISKNMFGAFLIVFENAQKKERWIASISIVVNIVGLGILVDTRLNFENRGSEH